MPEVRYAARRDEPAEAPRAPIKSWAKALWVEYEIDPEIHASLLPRPLSVGAEPLLHMSLGKVDMETGASFGFGATIADDGGRRFGIEWMSYLDERDGSLQAISIGVQF